MDNFSISSSSERVSIKLNALQKIIKKETYINESGDLIGKKELNKMKITPI